MLDTFRQSTPIDGDENDATIVEIVDMKGAKNIVVQKATGLTGTLVIERSLDKLTWFAVSGLSLGAGNVIDEDTPDTRFLRLTWTFGSGTGSIKVLTHIS